MTKMLRFGLAPLLAIAVLALPAPALGEYLIPPGNSAANQYTEALPTAGGNRKVDPEGKRKHPSPAKVLGRANAERLNRQGADGRAVAELVGTTAPVETIERRAPGGSDGAGATDGSGSHPDAGHGGGSRRAGHEAGSSGLTEVASAATGISAREVGLLLPLLLLATIAWAIVYFARRRRQPTR